MHNDISSFEHRPLLDCIIGAFEDWLIELDPPGLVHSPRYHHQLRAVPQLGQALESYIVHIQIDQQINHDFVTTPGEEGRGWMVTAAEASRVVGPAPTPHVCVSHTFSLA